MNMVLLLNKAKSAKIAHTLYRNDSVDLPAENYR